MILCCGEALIDMIPAQTVDGGTGFVPHAGGAVFNTAVALGRLGAKVSMLAGVSNDRFGEVLITGLEQSGVSLEHLVRSDRPTTLAFVHLIDGQATYSFFDENSAGRMLVPTDVPPIDSRATACFFGGISLACEPSAETYAGLVEDLAPNKLIMVDPNIRPTFIDDEPIYRARVKRIFAQADVVKLSDEDLDWLSPQTPSLEAKVQAIQADGVYCVLVTRGSAGATAYVKGRPPVQVRAPRVTVADTVGAGDTFNAGFLARLAELGLATKERLRSATTDDLTSCVEFAVRVAAVTVSRSGANPPWTSEL